jgi:HEAT repeat protein
VFVPEQSGNLERMFGNELWGVIGLVGIAILLVISCFLGETMAMIGLIGLIVIAAALSFWAGIWLLVIAFNEDAMCGLMCLFVPFYGLYYIITRFGDCYRALVVHAGGIVVVVLLVIGAVGGGYSFMRGEAARRAEGSRGGFFSRDSGSVLPPPSVPSRNLPRTLGKDRNDPEFIDLALQDLRSQEPDHRRHAASQLAEMRPNSRRREVVKALEETVADANGGVRAESLKALAVWGDKEHFTIVLKALEDHDHGVMRAAFDIASRSKDERAIEPLIEALPKLHGDAAQVLRSYGPAAEKALIKALKHTQPEVRREVCTLLKDMRVKEAATAMIEALDDSDRDVQRRAIEYFQRHKDERAAEALAECLDEHPHEAAQALRLIGAPAEKPILALVKSDSFRQRREAMGILKDIGTKESVAPLRALLMKRGRDHDMAKEVLQAIARRFPREFPADKPAIWEIDAITQALSDVQGTDVFRRGDALNELLKAQPNERKEEVIQVIEPLLKDRDRGVRAKSIEILGVWGGKEQAPTIIKMLDDEDGGAREASMRTLAKLQDERAIAPICLRLTNFFDRGHASKALKEFGVKAQVEVSKYCVHSDAGVRHEATKLLGQIGDKEAIPALQKLINQKQDRRLAEVATQALNELRVRLMSTEPPKEKDKEAGAKK